jgi:uncharacterized protein (TIGR03435 family)
MPDANDMDLVREYATRNSEPAFETLVRRHVSLVYSVALRQVGNPGQAEEITQAVFLILARKAARLRPDTVLAGWLHETARFASASFLRGELRRQRREQEAYVQSKLQESTTDPAWEQLAPLLDEAIGQLGKEDRNAVVLRFFQNKSAREIAAALNVHESAAQKRLNRAVEKLRVWFLKRGVAVSADALSGALLIHSVQGAPAHLAASIMAASAKGTAVSSSTLTLIKGALKIMAWTKAKTAIVSGVVVLLAAGTTTVTIKEIREHRTYSWQVQDYATRRKILNEAPPMVKLVPTKFPPSQGYTMVNGKMLGTGISLPTLLCSIYDSSPDRVVAAEPLPKGNVDFIATLPDGKSNNAALRREIEKQFHLLGRKEMRQADVLLLTVKNRNAPGLKRTAVTSDMVNLDSPPGRYEGSNVPLAYFARFLEYYFGTPVLDRTEIAYRLDINLKWDEPDPQNRDPEAMKRLLLNELGLELVPSREAVEMLVIEKVK